jgi:hypothetical protein
MSVYLIAESLSDMQRSFGKRCKQYMTPLMQLAFFLDPQYKKVATEIFPLRPDLLVEVRVDH